MLFTTLPITFRNATDLKKCAKNIATGTIARDITETSVEIKENYNELVNPVKTMEERS